mmetsp:Transcript_71738/g.214180  ORF Transcript_71738/g.214180 Transcript_71738/m.214180 type:complete len:356 (+) Transcript_71738:1118-2185(+)
MRKRSSFDFSSYLSREMPVRRAPCGLRIWSRYVNKSTPRRLQDHRTQPSSSAASLRLGWQRWRAHQRNRSAGGSWPCRSWSRQQVTMLSTPPERLSTTPRASLSRPSSCRERLRTPTSAWPSKRLRVAGSRRPARKGGSTPPTANGGSVPAAAACCRQRASRTSSRGKSPSGGPLNTRGSSAVSAWSRYPSTLTAWTASLVSTRNRSHSSRAGAELSPAARAISAEMARSMRRARSMRSGCRECRSTRDRKHSSAGVPSARSPEPESGPPASATTDSARGTAAASHAARRPAIPGAVSPRTDAMFRDIWSRKTAARRRRRASARGGTPGCAAAQAPPMPIGRREAERTAASSGAS